MKKNTYLWVFYLTTSLLFFTAIVSFGQSLLITPERTYSENTYGDNLTINSNYSFIGIRSIRYNGTAVSKLPVINNDYLFRIGASGYYDPNNITFESASIYFRASENWSSLANGTKISFQTTSNNTLGLKERMVIDHSGNIGIGTATPADILHIKSQQPVLHLQTTLGVGFGPMIKASAIDEPGVWENNFAPGSSPTSSLVYWNNPTFNTTPLTISGEGDAYIERNTSVGGYTNLGATAPKIKMKELSITTSAAAGGEVTIAHGLTQAKILSVSVLVNAVSGNDIPPSYSTTKYSGYLYFFWVNASGITIENSDGNHASIAGRPARILITYKE